MDNPALHLLKAKLCQRELRGEAPTAVRVAPELYQVLCLEERRASHADGQPVLLRTPDRLSILGIDVREDDRLNAFEFED